MKTFIKWNGNKSRYLKHILPEIPADYDTYIEPFLGSGAVFLALLPKKWIINDLNTDLIDIWNIVKNNPEEMIKEFCKFGKVFLPLSAKERVSLCKPLTEKLQTMKSSFKRSVIYILMKYCAYMGNIHFSGNKYKFWSLETNLYEGNTVPKFLSDKFYEELCEISHYLNTRGKIFNRDYKYTLSLSKQSDFVFIDPPYIERHDYKFQYNKNEILDDKFLLELLLEVQKLDKKKVRWLMTQANTKEVRKVFKGYKMSKFSVYRGMKNKFEEELLIRNY